MPIRLKYLFTLKSFFKYAHPRLKGEFYKGQWLEINRDGVLTIPAGYSWDGCTPKFKIFGRVIGVPDGPKDPETGQPQTYYASLVHDALYQFIGLHGISRADIDLIFLDMLTAAGFKQARLYYRAVQLFGGIFVKITR